MSLMDCVAPELSNLRGVSWANLACVVRSASPFVKSFTQQLLQVLAVLMKSALRKSSTPTLRACCHWPTTLNIRSMRSVTFCTAPCYADAVRHGARRLRVGRRLAPASTFRRQRVQRLSFWARAACLISVLPLASVNVRLLLRTQRGARRAPWEATRVLLRKLAATGQR